MEIKSQERKTKREKLGNKRDKKDKQEGGREGERVTGGRARGRGKEGNSSNGGREKKNQCVSMVNARFI